MFFREAIQGKADLDGDGITMGGELIGYIEKRYNDAIPTPSVATYGYQEFVHDRGVVPQDALFFWQTSPVRARSKGEDQSDLGTRKPGIRGVPVKPGPKRR